MQAAAPSTDGYLLTYNAAKPHKLLAMPGAAGNPQAEFLRRPCLLFDLKKKTVKYFLVEDAAGLHRHAEEGFKDRQIAFTHRMVLVLETYSIGG